MGCSRTLKSLQAAAIRHWPQELCEKIREGSILDILLATQEKFLDVLKVATATPESWLSVLDHCQNFPKKLFLKHLLVLSDVGGEALNKLPPLTRYIPDGILIIPWFGGKYKYEFMEISEACTLTNSALKIDEKSLGQKEDIFTKKMKDVAMLILYGGLSLGNTLPSEIQEKCMIGGLIGDDEGLAVFVRQNYIRVSRQLAGATANSLGQNVQKFVRESLVERLPASWEVINNGILPGVSHTTDGSETTFDVVVKSPSGKYCGIEVSFQVTTNSVIERKARESEALHRSCASAGHKIAYVIDGAGNIDVRTHAVSTICANSDCTVTFADTELEKLAIFLGDVLS